MGDTAAATVVVGIFILIVAFGFFWGRSTVPDKDTFDCTNQCNGRHSLYEPTEKLCYCAVK